MLTRGNVVQSNYAATVSIQLAAKWLCYVVIVSQYISTAAVIVWALKCQTAAVFVAK